MFKPVQNINSWNHNYIGGILHQTKQQTKQQTKHKTKHTQKQKINQHITTKIIRFFQVFGIQMLHLFVPYHGDDFIVQLHGLQGGHTHSTEIILAYCRIKRLNVTKKESGTGKWK
jgi:hypothetical protein